MNNLDAKHFLIVLVCCLLVMINVSQAETINGATDHAKKVSALLINGAYQPSLPSVMPMRAGYLTVKNVSPKLVIIRSVSSPDYESVHIHQSGIADGLSSMKMLQHLTLEPGQEITLAPGGIHLMLHHPKYQHRLGDNILMIFQLDSGDDITFEMQVTKP
ncbi:MAG: copper(I)-binding protein [Candidatus Endobugula sp.]|jgi:copper(I)-binding protein